MSRPSHSRRVARTRLCRRTLRASGGVLLAGLLLGTSARAEDAAGCAPFDEAYGAELQIARAEAVEPVAPATGGARPGAIVTLPAAPALSPEEPAGEVLLALPKDAAGALPDGTELGPGARVAESFFSPVLCATIARVVGPEDADARALVPGVPDTATVVPNSVYFTAQAEVTAAEPARDPRPDPYRPLQYALDQTGVDAARGASDGAGVTVAVLDSAPAADHRDLAAVRVARVEDGPGEAPAVHGTLVAGVVAATEDNGFGMAGVAPGVDLLAVPVCTSVGA
ncbi:MAG: S8 family serine peptidase, partial [Myxococcota bacterium]